MTGKFVEPHCTVLGIRKRRELSEATLAALRARLPRSEGVSSPPIAPNDDPVVEDQPMVERTSDGADQP